MSRRNSYSPNIEGLLRGSGERYHAGSRWGNDPQLIGGRGRGTSAPSPQLSHLYWRVSDTSGGIDEDEDTLTGEAKVNGGVVYTPALSFPTDQGFNSGLKPYEAHLVDEAFFPEPTHTPLPHPAIHNGDTLFLRIKWSDEPGAEPPIPPPMTGFHRLDFIGETEDILDELPIDTHEYDTEISTVTDPDHLHTVIVNAQVVPVKSGAASKVAAHLLSTAVQYAGYDWGVVNASAVPFPPASTRTQTYIPIADFEIDIDNGAMTIKQRTVGYPIFAHPYVFYYGAGIVSSPV